MMNQDFDAAAYEAFEQAALDKYDFQTCQRADGTYYGTGGTCKKGTPVKGVPRKKTKKMADMRAKDLKARGASGENHGKQVKGGGGSVPAPGTPERKVFDAKSDLDSAKKDLARKDLTPAERARATTMKNQAERDLKAAKKSKWDDFNKKSKAEEDKLRKKAANKKPDGGLTEAQVRAGGGRLD